VFHDNGIMLDSGDRGDVRMIEQSEHRFALEARHARRVWAKTPDTDI
jgi:hypothetical protein